MSREVKARIVSDLSQLDKQELLAVKLAIENLGPGSPGPKSTNEGSEDDTEEQQIFYREAIKLLDDRGLPCKPWNVFRRLNVYKHLKDKFPNVEEYTKKNFGNLNKRNRQRLYRIYSELLYDWMELHPAVPMRMGVFFQNLNQIPTLVAQSFPGYAEQGWLPLILKLGRRDHGAADKAD